MIDLGGSSVKAVAIETNGNILYQVNVGFESGESMEWAQKISTLLRQIQDQCQEPARSVGLSAPGLASRDGRSIAYMPGRLEGLVGLDWTTHLKTPVVVLNDAHAALLGEAWLGAAKGFENVIMLTLGTGVGGRSHGGRTLIARPFRKGRPPGPHLPRYRRSSRCLWRSW